MGFGGGAPKSLLEYIKIAKKNNIKTIAVGQITKEPKEYEQNNIQIVNLPHFKLKKPISSFIILIKYLTLIKQEKPNLIHAITATNCYFHTIIEDILKIPIVYTIPGGVISKLTSKALYNKEIIVFSKENKSTLIEYDHNPEKIHVITNRIDFESREVSLRRETENEKTTIKFVITSRLSPDKTNSVIHLMKVVKKLNIDGIEVELDIVGDGKEFVRINSYAKEINLSLKKNKVNVHGYKSNVDPYIKEADFVFGKGRSVIDGIIAKKPSFVIDENNNIIKISHTNFVNLSNNNFTGRNNNNPVTTYSELLEFTQNYLVQDEKNVSEVLYQLTKSEYDINIVEKKILELYNSKYKSETNYTYSVIRVAIKYIRFYLGLIMGELSTRR